MAQVAITSATSANDSRVLGLRFLGDGADRYRLVADVAYADLAAMRSTRAARQNRQSLLIGTARILVWSVREAMRGMFFLLFRRNNRQHATGQQTGLPIAGALPADPLARTEPAGQHAAMPARGARLPDVGLADFAPANTL